MASSNDGRAARFCRRDGAGFALGLLRIGLLRIGFFFVGIPFPPKLPAYTQPGGRQRSPVTHRERVAARTCFIVYWEVGGNADEHEEPICVRTDHPDRDGGNRAGR